MSYNINLQQIADDLGFDLEDVEMLFEVFINDAKESLLNLKEAIYINDLDLIFTFAHSIKGSSANLMLTDISNIAKEIEHGAKEKKSIEYSKLFENLQTQIENI